MVARNSPRLGRCGGNSARLTKCNCLAGYRVQPAPTRYRGGLGSHSLRQELAPEWGGFKSPEPALIRPGARRRKKKESYINIDYIITITNRTFISATSKVKIIII